MGKSTLGIIPEWTEALCGDGSGYGDGSGSGYGYGDGSGYGDGDGYGDGSGYGYGDGSGYGYGDGSGSGYGYGYGVILAAKTAATNLSCHSDAFLALWKSNIDGTPANGGDLPAVKVGDVHEVAGPLELCGPRALHATFNPEKWKGDRIWIVALYGEIKFDGDKMGALKREIIAELK